MGLQGAGGIPRRVEDSQVRRGGPRGQGSDKWRSGIQGERGLRGMGAWVGGEDCTVLHQVFFGASFCLCPLFLP